MESQILINYTETEDSFLLAINAGDTRKTYSEKTPEAESIIAQLNDIVNELN